ncbi:hypothetical protein PSTG_09791 [Puccinia striiformis f. sp. tritici PST-78]|uniref:HAT C-terminal dimerisation domain-containing protein n=1 Tax=Puccinia striiformis f. sp. tritici PST-78 TaxID=1165861 RepID=A0A0L0VCC0_9BASI|nr:hypothetical protein PSTG_09791 [Puccinia striiformis f. sp. tritici PST-78]
MEAPVANELTYLSGIYNLHSDHGRSHEFPILALLTRDYLACCATSTSVERCLSAQQIVTLANQEREEKAKKSAIESTEE